MVFGERIIGLVFTATVGTGDVGELRRFIIGEVKHSLLGKRHDDHGTIEDRDSYVEKIPGVFQPIIASFLGAFGFARTVSRAVNGGFSIVLAMLGCLHLKIA